MEKYICFCAEISRLSADLVLVASAGARRLEPAGFYCGRNFGSELVRAHADQFDGDGRRLCWDQECLGAWDVRATSWH